MARKTKDESARTREIILDAAEIEMQQHGVSETSLKQIADRAEVTRGAIYWHFTDKTGLLKSMVARTHLPFRDLLDQLSRDIPRSKPRRLLREMLLHTMHRLATDEQHRRVSHILLHRYGAEPYQDCPTSLIRPLFCDSRAAMIDLCTDIIATYDTPLALSAEEAADVILAFISGLYETVVRHGSLETAATNPDGKVDALLAGLFPVAEFQEPGP